MDRWCCRENCTQMGRPSQRGQDGRNLKDRHVCGISWQSAQHTVEARESELTKMRDSRGSACALADGY